MIKIFQTFVGKSLPEVAEMVVEKKLMVLMCEQNKF